MNRRLRDAIHVDELRSFISVSFEPRPQTLRFERLAAEDHQTQVQPGVFISALFCEHELTECRRCLIENGDAFLAKQFAKNFGRAADEVRDDDYASAVKQRAPQFPDGKVERV